MSEVLVSIMTLTDYCYSANVMLNHLNTCETHFNCYVLRLVKNVKYFSTSQGKENSLLLFSFYVHKDLHGLFFLLSVFLMPETHSVNLVQKLYGESFTSELEDWNNLLSFSCKSSFWQDYKVCTPKALCEKQTKKQKKTNLSYVYDSCF